MNDSLDKVLEIVASKAYERGKAEATSIALGYSGYGSCDSAIVAVPFTSFLGLRNAIRDRRWRRYGDNPGQAFAGNCKLLMIHHGDDKLNVAILLCSTSYDV
jgi:hypothetical protein